MAKYKIWWYTGDEPTQETEMERPFELSADELEAEAKTELNRRYSRGYRTIENIELCYDKEQMRKEITKTVKSLDRYKEYYCDESDQWILYFYDQNDKKLNKIKETFNVGEAIDDAIHEYEETKNIITKTYYENSKYFETIVRI